MIEKIVELMAELEDEELYEEVKKEVESGTPNMEIIDSLQKGMEIVGERFESKEYFIAELAFSAEIFEECSKLLPEGEEGEAKYGNFVLGTVYTDLHDIGKNIVHSVFKCNGFNVIDIGIDAKPEQFIEAIKEYDPKVVGMSCLLTTSFDPMKDCINQIREAGLDKGRLILIGGTPIDENTCKYVNADEYVNDAQKGLVIARNFVENAR